MFYDGTNVLVTGGASFIGSHLVDRLVALGAKVRVVDDLSSGEKENLDESIGEIEFVEADLRDQSVADAAVKDQSVVFHLANIHGGRGFIETHVGEIVQNLMIDGNLLKSAHEQGIDRFCYTSSACVYPTNLQSADQSEQVRYLSEEMADPFKQGAALADGEYGWCKLMGEMALTAYNKQFGLKGVSCRLFTVYGSRENETHAIIAFIAKALVGMDPYEIWGSGQQDRNFTHVDDVVEGLLRAAESIDDCRAVNIGTDEIIKIADAAKTVCDIVEHSPREFFFDKTKPEGVHARAADTSNQEQWLGWRPEVSFADGIRETIEWYKAKVDIDALRADLERKLMER
ncbi:MAG: SDR family NAD(P)-dependent oxidoreductase [Pseudomonadota bacterium]